MTGDVYTEFTLLLLAAALIGAVGVRLRQPLIVAYIVVGIAVGPSMLGWVTAHDKVDLLAQIGVTLLLFVVGLKLDIHLVRNLGGVALATGLGQLLFTIVFGYLIALALGMSAMTALYIAVALTFSSTIIIVKLLSDKREIDSLHGRIALGFLIVQDIAVVVAMMVLGAYNAGSGESWLAISATVGVKFAGALIVVALLMRYVLPRMLHLLAGSPELLLLFAIAWATTLATAGELLGFSKEVGAFLAGFSLASTPYREAMSTRLTSLRDFLLLFFFIDLGAKLDLSALGGDLGGAFVLSLFVLIGNPLIVMAIMGWMGYRKRTGFLAGLTVAQISEFSIVFVAMGITLGHIGQGALGLVTLVGLVTITLSTYMILYSQRLYGWLQALARHFRAAHAFPRTRRRAAAGRLRPDRCYRLRHGPLRQAPGAASVQARHGGARRRLRSGNGGALPPARHGDPLRRCGRPCFPRDAAAGRHALGGQHAAGDRREPRPVRRAAPPWLHWPRRHDRPRRP